MTDRDGWARARRQRKAEPVKRALLLMALGLDPHLHYTDDELRGAARRQKTQLRPVRGTPGITATAIDAAYATLVGGSGAGPQLNLEV
jgi:hypothetical protein